MEKEEMMSAKELVIKARPLVTMRLDPFYLSIGCDGRQYRGESTLYYSIDYRSALIELMANHSVALHRLRLLRVAALEERRYIILTEGGGGGGPVVSNDYSLGGELPPVAVVVVNPQNTSYCSVL